MAGMALNEQAIFEAARKLDSRETRAAYLSKVCRGDDVLAQRIHALLNAYEGSASFLESPAVALQVPVCERAGTVIGPYRLLQQIGEGGMGIVWMAEQLRPVQRKVALKVIKPGMDSRQVIARFEAERQALAMMDHVNIARVFDGGTTENGRPYFVMELVHGVPITKYCDDNHLTPRERLELFVPVCRAIHHAHQKGIIHRDIKASNVMVTLYDGKPVPKVIDFGIAKAIDQKLTERTLFTQFGMMVGTLEYMSPEQAEMSALGVDTRSDIYSLGVLLYELLTGSTPLPHKRLKGEAYGEILRILKEEEPQKPSTRLSGSGEALVSISAVRNTEPVKLTRLMRGELDWIVMRALEKDRERRYETADAFVADIQRYLHDEPVQACPPSAWYRLSKFTRRHKVGLAVATVVAVAVLVAVGSLGWIAHDRQTRLGVTARQVTESLRDVQSLYQSGKLPEAVLVAKTAHGQLQSGGGSEELRQRVQDWLADLDMVDRLEEIRFRWANNETGYAADFHKAFRDYGIDVLSLPVAESGARIAAKPIRVDLAAALDVWALGNDPTFDMGLQSKLLDIARVADPVRNQLRDGFARKGELEELVHSIDLESQPLATLELLSVLLPKGEPRIAFLRRLHRRLPDNFRINVALAVELAAAKRHNDAVRFDTAAVALRPKSRLAHMNLGTALGSQGSTDEGIASLRMAIHLDPKYARAHQNLGWLLQGKGLLDDAIAAFREAIRLKPDYADAHLNLGFVLDNKGLIDEAIDSYREAIRLAPREPWAHHNLGLALMRKAESEEGLLDDAIACYREAVRLDPAYQKAHHNLGLALFRKGALDEAANAFREAHERRRKALGADHSVTLGSLDERIKVHVALGKQDLVEPLLRERLTMYERKEPGTWQRYDCMSKLGACLADQRKFEDAEPLLLGSYEGMKLGMKDRGPDSQHAARLAVASERVVQLYDSWGKSDEAGQWRKQLELHKQERDAKRDVK